MGALNLTIQVQNVDPNVTTAELEMFFSYCGTVDKIQLQRNTDKSQSAKVTFRQPFAFWTALLLDNADVAGQPIQVLPSEGSIKVLPSIMLEGDAKEHARPVPVVLRPNEAVTPGSTIPILDRIRDKLEKHKLSENGRVLVNQACSAIHSAEKAAKSFGSLLAENPYVAPGLMFLSGALYKAAMYASQVGARKRN